MRKKPCNSKSSSACTPRNQEHRRPKKKNIKTQTEHEPEGVAEGIKAVAGDTNYPGVTWPVGLTPRPYQLEAVKFAIERLKKFNSVYLGLDAGLGKTICAALLSNFYNAKAPTKIFYVCPPFLTTNTDSEFSIWCHTKNLYLIPDSKLSRKGTSAKTVEDIKNALTLWPGETVLIVDEAHRFKNASTGRTKVLLKKVLPLFEKIIWLSGTPIPNGRPVEIWPIMLHSAPEVFGKEFFRNYGLKYCGGFQHDYGWDFSGFTNRKEWKARIQRSFMIRIRKSALDLPPKLEGLLVVGEGLPPVVSRVESEILRAYSKEDLMAGKLAAREGAAALHLATYLRLLGEYKVKYAVPIIEQILEETTDNLLIFAVHKETIAKLRYELSDYDPLVIDGDVPVSKRQAIVKTFQESKDRRVFIGNIQACGVGFTLTKANRVIFTEFSWVDGENTQAADRAHRIGQKETVQVQYVVLKDSIDRQRMEVLLKKRRLSI